MRGTATSEDISLFTHKMANYILMNRGFRCLDYAPALLLGEPQSVRIGNMPKPKPLGLSASTVRRYRAQFAGAACPTLLARIVNPNANESGVSRRESDGIDPGVRRRLCSAFMSCFVVRCDLFCPADEHLRPVY